MSNDYFRFKQFCIHQERSAMKVGTDGVLIGAWCTIPDEAKQILDVGCGSGLIAIMLAQRTEHCRARIKAIDIDHDSTLQSHENVADTPWRDRIDVECVSLQDFCSREVNEKFDLVVSNPPFFVDSLKAPDPQRNNSRHCNTLSHRELLKCSAELLKDKGILAVVLPTNEAKQLVEMSAVYGFVVSRICAVKSTERKAEIRHLVEMIKTTEWQSCNHTSLCIHSRADYSDEYKALTREFYLKF